MGLLDAFIKIVSRGERYDEVRRRYRTLRRTIWKSRRTLKNEQSTPG